MGFNKKESLSRLVTSKWPKEFRVKEGIINCPDVARYVITKISTNKKSLNNRAVFFVWGGDCMYKLYGIY